MSLQDIKWDSNGLVPAIIQDAQSKEVLMMGYMNQQSLTLSKESGYTWFWSRSRNELWNKGATSGHKQRIISMSYDCDGDTLLVKVIQSGPACHTGSYSCFTNEIEIDQQESAKVDLSEQDRFSMLSELEQTIAKRHAERPAGSYTTYLFDKGVDKILKKIGEESAEVIIATKNDDNDELRSEATDLIFHLSVLMRERGLSWDDIMGELKSREGKQTTNKMR